MKIFIAFAAFVALCSGHAIPTVPGDNSHYVEGESRYVWMPDGEGKPVLVDLDEPVDHALVNARNGANNQYWLFTRRNPNNAQILVNGNINSVRNSNYASNRNLKVIVHGWNNNGNSPLNPLITSAFLAVEDANVIVVDWRSLAGSSYNNAAAGVPGIGQHLGNFLVWLINNAGGNWNNVHLVGHSLGAHVAGNAGRQSGNRPRRITGLDPAGPRWGGNGNALNRNNGRYVEAIHTDGNILGIMNPIADADFYPNGGKNPQPGCSISTCSHGRANDLFASTVRFNRLVGRRCANIWEAELSTCNGASFNMGNANLGKSGRNPGNAQILVNGNINSVRNSNYASNRALKVIVHGLNNNGHSPLNPLITSAFLAVQDVNVIVVDWHGPANSGYGNAFNAVPNVGQHLGNFLVWLINNAGGNWDNVHLVGHSLGAHVVGNAGRQAGGRPRRVTGLDPANHGWHNNGNALNRNSGRYVEAIHTDGHVAGIMSAVGHADFYPNGGKNPQPGCYTSFCSHGRANDLFAATVRHNHLIGRWCPNIWEAELSTCNGASLHMGTANLAKTGNGHYALRTGRTWPF